MDELNYPELVKGTRSQVNPGLNDYFFVFVPLFGLGAWALINALFHLIVRKARVVLCIHQSIQKWHIPLLTPYLKYLYIQGG